MASPWIIARFIKSYQANGMDSDALVRLLPPGVFAATSAVRALFGAGFLTQAMLAANSLDSTVVANIASVSAGVLTAAAIGIPVTVMLDITDGATANIDFTNMPYKMRVLDACVVKTGAAGGAGDTITVQNAANPVTNAMSINMATKTIVWNTTLDTGFWDVPAAGTLRVVRTKASANNVACTVVLTLVRVA